MLLKCGKLRKKSKKMHCACNMGITGGVQAENGLILRGKRGCIT